jgi:hypothetical protein
MQSLCNASVSRPLEQRKGICIGLTILLTVSYTIVAIAALLCFKWESRKLIAIGLKARGPHIWPLYRRFSLVMALGCAFAVPVWILRAYSRISFWEGQQYAAIRGPDDTSPPPPGLRWKLFAHSQFSFGAFLVFYSIQVFCLVLVRLMVLHRLLHFSIRSLSPLRQTRYRWGMRAIFVFVCLGKSSSLPIPSLASLLTWS